MHEIYFVTAAGLHENIRQLFLCYVKSATSQGIFLSLAFMYISTFCLELALSAANIHNIY